MHNLLFVVKDKSCILNHAAYLISKKIRVDIIENYFDARIYLNDRKIDIIIGDILIKDKEIGEFIKEISETHQKPIIFALTDELTSYESIYALNSGAQNVFHTNKSSKLLYAQIQSTLKVTNRGSIIEHDGLYINNENYTVFYQKKEVKLSTKEFKILSYICSKNGLICSREELIHNYWKHKNSNPRIVDVYIRKIRIKTSIHLIKSVHGIGYRINN